MSATVPPPLGSVAHYTLLERLDAAGPGDLYRGRDTRLGRTVTVRVLPEGYPADPEARARLVDSARAVSALSHPNITLLYDVGEHDGRVFLVFEFLTGQPLRAEMAGRPMNVRRAVEVAVQIANAVAEAHAAGYMHSGLSPDTIVITAKGHAKIPALELATRAGFAPDADVRLLDYQAPEETRGEVGDERSDTYSVAAMLYEMLTTRRPSPKGASAPSGANPHVPADLDDVVLRAVAPNPESRIRSAAVLAAELRTVAGALDAQSTPSDEEQARTETTSVGRVVAVALAILTGLAAVAYFIAR